jgi:hypothetical protein
LALLTAACSNDSASRITAPSLSASMDKSSSAAAGDFAVLAGTAVTCTNSTVTGDVGVWPGTAVTQTGCTINGRIHAGDGVAKKAFEAFLAEYTHVADIACTGGDAFTLASAYGPVTLNLPPGVYCSAAAVTFTGTTLNLVGPADGIWIFKIGTSGTGALTGTNFSVFMTGGDPCNVTWWTAEAATITDSDSNVLHYFVGTILSGTAIDITGGAGGAGANRTTFTGDAFAKTAVTMTDTNLTGCAGGRGHGNGKEKCNQGVGNGPEICDPGNSNQGDPSRSNDELGGTPGNPGRKGGNGK